MGPYSQKLIAMNFLALGYLSLEILNYVLESLTFEIASSIAGTHPVLQMDSQKKTTAAKEASCFRKSTDSKTPLSVGLTVQ